MKQYFIAIILPEPYQQQITAFKKYMLEEYSCRVALKSPAHITLISPFYMKEEKEAGLKERLQEFQYLSFPVFFEGFDTFVPRVIFVNVQKNNQLQELYYQLEAYLLSYPFGINKSKRIFRPHITIANRDLKEEDFPRAKKHFDNITYSGAFKTKKLSLLKHNGKRWDEIAVNIL